MEFQSHWTRNTLGQLAGLATAAETDAVLAWDTAQRLHVWDTKGLPLGEQALRFLPAAAAISGDGRWVVVSDKVGRLSWYDDRLTLQFDYATEVAPLGFALEAYGQYVLLSDRQRHGWLFTRQGKPMAEFETPRPLHHLAFLLPEASWIGCSDYGFIGCYDAQGQSRWRDKPLVNVASFATDGSSLVALACYTEGLLLYEPLGGVGTAAALPGTCRQVRVSGNGKYLWVLRDLTGRGGLSLSLLRSEGTVLGNLVVPATTTYLAAGALGTTCVYGTSEGQIVKVVAKLPA
jgi:hypothetical protein